MGICRARMMHDLRQLAHSKYSRGEYRDAAQLLLLVADAKCEWELSLCLDEDQTGATRVMMEEKAAQGNATALYQLGFLYMSSAPQAALDYFIKAFNAGYTGALVQTGRCYAAMGRTEDARRAFMETITRGVDVALAQEELAMIEDTIEIEIPAHLPMLPSPAPLQMHYALRDGLCLSVSDSSHQQP